MITLDEVEITDSQEEFLQRIINEDGANSEEDAIRWCIASCQRIEANYRMDACFVSFNDVRRENAPPFKDIEIDLEYPNGKSDSKPIQEREEAMKAFAMFVVGMEEENHSSEETLSDRLDGYMEKFMNS